MWSSHGLHQCGHRAALSWHLQLLLSPARSTCPAETGTWSIQACSSQLVLVCILLLRGFGLIKVTYFLWQENLVRISFFNILQTLCSPSPFSAEDSWYFPALGVFCTRKDIAMDHFLLCQSSNSASFFYALLEREEKGTL